MFSNKTKKIIVAFVLWCLFWLIIVCMSGCYQDATGGWRLGTKEADAIGKGLDAAKGGLDLLSLFIPGAAALAAGTAGVAGAFKKLKPELTKQKKTTDHIVTTIEWIKRYHPDIWEKVKGEFKHGTDADIEEVIEKTIALHKTIKETI